MNYVGVLMMINCILKYCSLELKKTKSVNALTRDGRTEIMAKPREESRTRRQKSARVEVFRRGTGKPITTLIVV